MFKKTDIESYFKEELGCQFVPREIVEFYKKADDFSLSFVNDVFSLCEIKSYYDDIDEFLEYEYDMAMDILAE